MTDTYTYDVTTPPGMVRLLIPDTDLTNPIFNDAEIAAFLALNSGPSGFVGYLGDTVRLAAAQAMDVIASSELYVLKVIRTLGLQTNADALAQQYRVLSAELRRQVYEGSGDFTGMFDWAEEVVDTFSERERIVAQFLRDDSQ